jgi:hypothetical protein
MTGALFQYAQFISGPLVWAGMIVWAIRRGERS